MELLQTVSFSTVLENTISDWNLARRTVLQLPWWGIREHYKWLKLYESTRLYVCYPVLENTISDWNKLYVVYTCSFSIVLENTISDWNLFCVAPCSHHNRIREHYKWLKLNEIKKAGGQIPVLENTISDWNSYIIFHPFSPYSVLENTISDWNR